MDDAIEVLCSTLDFMQTDAFKNSELTFSKGCVLIGHPGCGKTMLMSAIKEKYVTDGPYRLLQGNKGILGSSKVSEVTNQVEKFFEPVHSFPDETFIIFFDEIDQVIVSKDNRSVLTTELTTAINTELSGLNSCKNMYIIGTTNYPHRMDVASIRSGRLEDTIYIQDPEYINRVKLVQIYFEPELDLCDFNEEVIQKIALKTPGFNGSDYDSMAATLLKQQTLRRLMDPLYKLNSQHVYQLITRHSVKKSHMQVGFKEFWIEACNCIDL